MSLYELFIESAATPVDPYAVEQSATIPPGFILLPSYIDKSYHIETTLGYADIQILIAAENSKPAVEVRPLPLTIITYLDPYSKKNALGLQELVFDYSLSDILRMFNTMSEKDFITSCTNLKNKWVYFENLSLDKLNSSTYDLTASPLSKEELEIKVKPGQLQLVGYGVQEKSRVTIFGIISLCDKADVIQIWLDSAIIQKFQVATP